MRYRRQDVNGDYVFGHSAADFLVNSPATVGQAISTRLQLWLGEYFLDLTQGMPWQTQVLGYNEKQVYDAAVRDCISETPGFSEIVTYSSVLDSRSRVLAIRALIQTVYSDQPTLLQTQMYLTGYGVGGFGDRPYGE